ncbi:MAG: response regulator transcription factor [Sphingobium sp.]
MNIRIDNSGTAVAPALIVEDDPAMQRRLTGLLASIAGADSPIAVAGSLTAARRLIDETRFAFALVDIGLPDGDGRDLIAWLHDHRPAMTVVVISAWGDDAVVLAALKSGAIGYLLKEREDSELALWLRSIERGGAPIDPLIARRILTLLPAQPPARRNEPSTDLHLTAREREILELVSRGHSNREIAERLALSRLTVEGYTKAIYRKLAVGSRTAAVHEAKSLGLLD